MLNKQLCEICNIDKAAQFFINYLDELDDKIAAEKDEGKKMCMLYDKQIIVNLKEAYFNTHL